MQHLEVAVDQLADTGPEQLDDHFRAVMQLRAVHLGNGRSGERFHVKTREHLTDRFAVGRIKHGDGLGRRKRRHAVLQAGQFIGDVRRQQVAARGDGLAELDEDRAEFLEREAYPHAERRRFVALAGQQVEKKPERPEEVRRRDEVIETVPDKHALDDKEP